MLYEIVTKNTHIYCHSRKDGKEGCVYLVINISLVDTMSIELTQTADRYTLAADTLRRKIMKLNGKELKIRGINDFPEMRPKKEKSGTIRLPPATCTFLVM